MPQSFRLTLSAEPSEAKRLRNELQAWLVDAAGINGATGQDIAIAVNEAFINAVEHPQNRRDDSITVTGEVSESALVVRVTDNGDWQPTPVDLEREHYGQHLMGALMSRVRIDRGDEGTTVILCKRTSTHPPS